MERNEKEHEREYEQGIEPERGDFTVNDSFEERGGEDVRILEEFDKKRWQGKIEYIQSILEGIVFRMGVEAQVVAEEVGGDIRLEMRGDSGGLLIGKHGRTLDALQYLVNKIYQRRFGEGVRIFVDTENYRKRRVEALEKLALRLGEKVKSRRRALVAGVFNSRDRRIIHMTLKGDELLATESKGEGPFKKLIIRPKWVGNGKDEREATP